MRASLFFLFCLLILGLFLWVTLSGALSFVALVFVLFFLIVMVGYADTVVLYLLSAREVRAGDERVFFEAASQEAYKLCVATPHLYFYNGTLDRAFVLQNKRKVSLVISKNLLERSSHADLSAICFEMLVQVKRGMATKRTKTMFLLGTFSWIVHAILAIFLVFLPYRDVRRGFEWILNFLLQPTLGLLFKLLIGKGYFQKLENILVEFEREKELLRGLGQKIERLQSYYSLPSRKVFELAAVNRSRSYQNILSLEFLPHEWDFLFDQELKGA